MEVEVNLEPLSIDQVDRLTCLLDPIITRYLGPDAPTDLKSLTRQFSDLLEAERSSTPDWEFINRVIVLQPGNQLIGRLEALIQKDDAEIAIIVDCDHWGKGYAKRAVMKMIADLHAIFQVKRVWACVHPDNTRSLGLFRRMKFVVQDNNLVKIHLASADEGDIVMLHVTE